MHLRRPPAGLAHLLTLPAVYVGSTRTRLASGDRRLGPAGGLHDLHLQKMTHDPLLGVWMSAYTSTVGGSFEASAIDRASVVRLGKIAPKKPTAANKKKTAAALAAATQCSGLMTLAINLMNYHFIWSLLPYLFFS